MRPLRESAMAVEQVGARVELALDGARARARNPVACA
jgi:hypothetical protein